MSYYVPYYKIGISDNFDRLQDFIVDYFSLLDRKNLLIKDFREKYLKKLFGHHREEIHSRIKNNTAILGLGYWAISYIPWVASYSFDFSYKKIRKFYEDISYSWHSLSEKDNTNFLFLNNIRAGVDQELMKKAFSQADSSIWQLFKNIKKDLEINPDGTIVANVEDDMHIHMMALCFYWYEQRRVVFKRLLKKWIWLGNSYDDLEDNIDTYLSLYYRRS